jgi:hypothetical protein
MAKFNNLMTVKIDEMQLAILRKRLKGIKGINRMLKDAVNQTAVSSHNRIVKRIASKIKFPEKVLKKVIKIYKAKVATLTARINLRKGRIPAINLAPRKTGSGYSYQGAKKREKVEHAFKAQMPLKYSSGWVYGKGGHKGIFRRKIKGGKMVGRLPIMEIFGPSLPELFRNVEELAKKELGRIDKELLRNVRRGAKRLLKGQL